MGSPNTYFLRKGRYHDQSEQTFDSMPTLAARRLLAGGSIGQPVVNGFGTVASPPSASSGNPGPAFGPGHWKEALETGIEAYIYGYPLVTMEMTRRVMTNVEKPEATRASMGNLLRARSYPDAKYRDVTAPNADTLGIRLR